MGLPKWASEALGIAKDVAMPDVQAWERVISGDGNLTDFISVATDVVSVVPGGALLKGAGKVGLAAAKHGGETRALAKWGDDPLYHGTSNPMKGNTIVPAGRSSYQGANSIRHPGGLTTLEPKVRASELRSNGAPRSSALFDHIKASRKPTPLEHKKYVFATPEKEYAKRFATEFTKGPQPQLLKVVPKSGPRNQLVRTSQASRRHDTHEVLSPAGYRIVGGRVKAGETWLAKDFSAAKLRSEVDWLKTSSTWALPTWGGAEAVDLVNP